MKEKTVYVVEVIYYMIIIKELDIHQNNPIIQQLK